MNEKADRAASANESGEGKKLSVVQCVDIHIQQNKINIISFLKQTTDKIFPVGQYLRQKIFLAKGTYEYDFAVVVIFYYNSP